ncbi:MAG TPA: hypothetical protein VMW63_09685 [Methanoregulaceae archaeon]|nr:hypothetical protein [Methanoregulaceae archaeon]
MDVKISIYIVVFVILCSFTIPVWGDVPCPFPDDGASSGDASPFPDDPVSQGDPCPFPDDGASSGDASPFIQAIPGVIGLDPGGGQPTGICAIPTDPDNDGLYEDLNGNGECDFGDVILFFNQMDWISVNEPVEPFDYNGNGMVDFNDLMILFARV